MHSETFEPIKKRLLINAAQKECFDAFVERLDEWWPHSHHIGKPEIKKCVLEAKPNGRWYEIGVDGSECEWGKVLVWDPPRRLVLAWQITAEWKYDPAFITEVEAKFTPEGPHKTWLDFEHRNLERFGAAAPGIRATLGSPGGWPGVLKAFVGLAEGGAR